MEFWTIVNKNKDGEYYNFKINEMDFYLSSNCLLPSLDLAKIALSELNNENYGILKIKITYYNEGRMETKYKFDKPEGWH